MGSERPSRTAAHELGAGLTVPAKSGPSRPRVECSFKTDLGRTNSADRWLLSGRERSARCPSPYIDRKGIFMQTW